MLTKEPKTSFIKRYTPQISDEYIYSSQLEPYIAIHEIMEVMYGWMPSFSLTHVPSRSKGRVGSSVIEVIAYYLTLV